MLNPYDVILNLGNKDDRKLFTDGCNSLKAEDLYDGKKQNYGNFVKIIEGELNATRTMEALEVNTMWNTGGDVDATCIYLSLTR